MGPVLCFFALLELGVWGGFFDDELARGLTYADFAKVIRLLLVMSLVVVCLGPGGGAWGLRVFKGGEGRIMVFKGDGEGGICRGVCRGAFAEARLPRHVYLVTFCAQGT